MKKVVAMAAALALAGCFGPSEEEKKAALIKEQERQALIEKEKTKSLIEQAVRDRLRDPASAQFGLLTMITPARACAAVNAKNGFGGYGGEKQAFVQRIEAKWHTLGLEDISHTQCIEISKTLKD